MKDFSRYEIAEVIAEEFDLINSDIQPMNYFGIDYEADEFDMMNLCAKLEDTFDMKIPPETEKKWNTVEDVYDFMDAAWACEFPEAKTITTAKNSEV